MQTYIYIQFVHVTKVDFFSPCGSEGIAAVFLLTFRILVVWTFLGDLGPDTLAPLQLVFSTRFILFCLIRKWFLAHFSCFCKDCYTSTLRDYTLSVTKWVQRDTSGLRYLHTIDSLPPKFTVRQELWNFLLQFCIKTGRFSYLLQK